MFLECLICGDIASGYNYECITCCSCKVFFHRNHDNKALDHPVYNEKENELEFINQGDTFTC
ncbi:unnamed protein product [Oppiella nova]|uniref:Nuclear receptor domain-containing protein n=1 Tax=Oppiella nova TaxID=334625 RepID=A0A7R9M2K7_9ACAR|nr:unnamed protein product [Oppiella nova]CAG2169375.1 unnamed protein product [Oppiella nova]